MIPVATGWRRTLRGGRAIDGHWARLVCMSGVNQIIDACLSLLRDTDHDTTTWYADRIAELPRVHTGDPLTAFPLGEFRDMSNVCSVLGKSVLDATRHALESLSWSRADKINVPPGWAHKAAVTQCIGPDGMIEAPDFRLGLFYIEPDTHYPTHWHAADEFYLVVAGRAQWVMDGGPPKTSAAGSLVEIPPMTRHATTTTDQPYFVVWGWRGDISFDNYWY